MISLPPHKLVLLAPMAGITDLPMRRTVREHGVDFAYSEMVASREIFQRPIALQRRLHVANESGALAIQLAGCDPYWMGEAARLCADLGATMIDINMGCPAKKVVSGQAAGSALMRDLELAGRLISATVAAAPVPVTLKMRTGWDDASRNAPELARRAQDMGVQMITVHGRTRCQFYSGEADWGFIGTVKDAVKVPVIANGDIVSEAAAAQALAQSGADGVMIGRGAQGRPWFPNQVRHYLATGSRLPAPPANVQHQVICAHYQAIIEHYGEQLGVRIARKHLGWYLANHPGGEAVRSQIVRMAASADVLKVLNRFFARQHMEVAA